MKIGEPNSNFLIAKSFSICGFTLEIASRDRELEGIIPPAIVVDDTAQIASKTDKMIIFFMVFFLMASTRRLV